MIMEKEKIYSHWKKAVDAISDAAKMGSKEFQRTATAAKNRWSKTQLIQKRKELFCELGRCLYEATEDGVPKPVERFLQTTELHEIVMDIKTVDEQIFQMK